MRRNQTLNFIGNDTLCKPDDMLVISGLAVVRVTRRIAAAAA
ncbi:hypothetical protein QTI17_28890 [Variovorax sp. J31P179]|nr:hypothetical protein [Variovorax sp. J31P179]MDM0084624.1 hypothetical protein [Variovorax sp. J31P179]